MVKVTSISDVRSMTWQDFGFTLLEATTTHAICIDEAAHHAFRQGLMDILHALKNNPRSSLITPAETTIKKIENYQTDNQQIINALLVELRNSIITMISAAVEEQKENQDAETILDHFQEKIEQAQSMNDLKATKDDLKVALSNLKEQASKRRQIASDLQANLRDRLIVLEQFHGGKSSSYSNAEDTSSGPLVLEGHTEVETVTLESFNGNLFPLAEQSPKEQFDSVTGLPSRDAFAESVLGLPPPRTRMYVAVFYFQRLEYINARYGYSIGDEVLMFCAQLLATKILGPTEQLFRWRGPSFCALIERKGTLADVRKDIRSRLGTRVQFMGSDDSVLLNIGVASDIRSAETPNLVDLIQELEKFVLLPSTRG